MKKFLTVLCLFAALIVGVYIYFAYFFDPFHCEDEFIMNSISPNKELSISLFQRDCGATTAVADRLVLSKGDMSKLIFTENERRITSLKWVSDKDLEVKSQYAPTRPIQENSFGVKISWKYDEVEPEFPRSSSFDVSDLLKNKQ